MTIQKIRREISKMDPALAQDSDHFRAAVILMSALQVGASKRALTRFTGIAKGSVSWIVDNIRRNGIFTRNGKVAGSEWFEKDGGCAFWLDVCCALGLLEKTKAA